jgi:hypothetical protein
MILYQTSAITAATTNRTATQASVNAPAPRSGIIRFTLCPRRIGSLRSIVLTSPPERKATRELFKPGGLSGELPAGTPVPFTLWRVSHHPSPAHWRCN